MSCVPCNGTGKVRKSRTVQDVTRSVTFGIALGIGFMPSYRTEYYDAKCSYCNGSGKR